MIVLFEHSEKRLADRLKFEAQIHGCKIKEPSSGHFASSSTTSTTVKGVERDNDFVFRDPEEYKRMSKEKREELTLRMMAKHKAWVEEQKPMGGKAARVG